MPQYELLQSRNLRPLSALEVNQIFPDYSFLKIARKVENVARRHCKRAIESRTASQSRSSQPQFVSPLLIISRTEKPSITPNIMTYAEFFPEEYATVVYSGALLQKMRHSENPKLALADTLLEEILHGFSSRARGHGTYVGFETDPYAKQNPLQPGEKSDTGVYELITAASSMQNISGKTVPDHEKGPELLLTEQVTKIADLLMLDDIVPNHILSLRRRYRLILLETRDGETIETYKREKGFLYDLLYSLLTGDKGFLEEHISSYLIPFLGNPGLFNIFNISERAYRLLNSEDPERWEKFDRLGVKDVYP